MQSILHYIAHPCLVALEANASYSFGAKKLPVANTEPISPSECRAWIQRNLGGNGTANRGKKHVEFDWCLDESRGHYALQFRAEKL